MKVVFARDLVPGLLPAARWSQGRGGQDRGRIQVQGKVEAGTGSWPGRKISILFLQAEQVPAMLHHSPNLSPCPVAMGLPVLFLALVPLAPGGLVLSPGPPPHTRWSCFPKLPLQTPFTPLGSNWSCTARKAGLCM